MNSREYILQQLRSAAPAERKPEPDPIGDKEIFCDMNTSGTGLLDQFIQHQEDLKGEVFVCPNISEMAIKLHSILGSFGPASSVYHSDPLIDELFSQKPELRNFFDLTDQTRLSSETFATYQAGLTGADCLVARTGSLFVNSINGGGRRLSVLPPVHIVVARESQLVASLEQAFAQLKDFNWSYATIITGPSRTSDIEKKLVLGAHGPKRLITLILNN